MLVSGVRRSDSGIRVCVCIFFFRWAHLDLLSPFYVLYWVLYSPWLIQSSQLSWERAGGAATLQVQKSKSAWPQSLSRMEARIGGGPTSPPAIRPREKCWLPRAHVSLLSGKPAVSPVSWESRGTGSWYNPSSFSPSSGIFATKGGQKTYSWCCWIFAPFAGREWECRGIKFIFF